MMRAPDVNLNRRRLLIRGGIGALGASALPLAPWLAAAQQEELCVNGKAERTVKQTAGPFHLSGAPLRDDFRVDGMHGEDLTVRGQVLDVACRPVAGAVLDVWQADPTGVYDTKSFQLRGKVESDAEGRYQFLTLSQARTARVLSEPPYLTSGFRQQAFVSSRQRSFPGRGTERQDARCSVRTPQ